MPPPSHYDCLIVGGGPAGAVLAWLLAGDGARVLLVDAGGRTGGAPRETLLSSALPALARVGLDGLIAAAATRDTHRHGAIWGRDQLQWRFDPEPGLLLERGRFEADLRAAAAARGVERRERTRVRGPLRSGEPIELVADGAAVERVTAAQIVIATGRRPARDLIALETVARGPETAALALSATCREAARLALVEAVASGWWWWIGDGQAGGTATLLCDALELRAIGSRRLLARAQAEALGPAHALGDAKLTHATRTTPGCWRTTSGVLLLGDAAATIDPLASQGVEKAVLAAEHAATAVRAAWHRPSWWPRLCAAHAEWERGLYAGHARTAAAFLAQEQRFKAAPFWRARHHAPGAAPPTDTRWVAAGEVQPAVVLERFGDGFREIDGAIHSGTGEARAAIGRVPVTAVLRWFAAPCTAAAAVAAARDDPRLFVLGPAAVAAAIVDLWERGWLRDASAATGTR